MPRHGRRRIVGQRQAAEGGPAPAGAETAMGGDSVSLRRQFGVLHLFCGIGGGAMGFQRGRAAWHSLEGTFRTLGGVDVDPEACADFEALTGVRATQLDLFTRADYEAFHGHAPDADWREAAADDIRVAAQGVCPDVVFTSSPCKGLSALLPKKQAESRKYEALNNLTVRGISLVLNAWPKHPPSLIIFENVPRITSRGAPLLAEIKALLEGAGCAIHEGNHDAGEIGGLSQHRRRYLLVARHVRQLPLVLNRPPVKRVRSIGYALQDLPLPDDPEGGPMHRLPRLQWLTWVRLALIPAGGDWRDLQGIEPGSYGIQPASDYYTHLYRVTSWDEPVGTVTAATRPAGGAAPVADPRLRHEPRKGVFGITPWSEPSGTITAAMRAAGSNVAASVADPRGGPYGVMDWSQASGTVTGNMRPSCGTTPASVADPRLPDAAGRHTAKFRVVNWKESAGTVTGSDSVGSGAPCVADPRLPSSRGATYKGSPGLMGVLDWQDPAPAVTGSASARGGNMAASVADPRIPSRPTRRSGDLTVHAWQDASGTITGEDSVGSGGRSVADPRLTCAPRSGAYGVIDWREPAGAVTGAGDVHAQGAAAVADPRIPGEREQGAWVIVAADGTWHRPLTTLELAVLQGFPHVMPDGRPLTLTGKSQARWRERLGNAVPPPAAQAIADQMLACLVPYHMAGLSFVLRACGTVVWVCSGLRRRVAAGWTRTRNSVLAIGGDSR